MVPRVGRCREKMASGARGRDHCPNLLLRRERSGERGKFLLNFFFHFSYGKNFGQAFS